MKLFEAENARNTANEGLFRAMLTMAYPDTDLVVAGHHIFWRRAGSAQHDEIPSADWLIFDHAIAKAIWGSGWTLRLHDLAMAPSDRRDDLLRIMFNSRHGTTF